MPPMRGQPHQATTAGTARRARMCMHACEFLQSLLTRDRLVAAVRTPYTRGTGVCRRTYRIRGTGVCRRTYRTRGTGACRRTYRIRGTGVCRRMYRTRGTGACRRGVSNPRKQYGHFDRLLSGPPPRVEGGAKTHTFSRLSRSGSSHPRSCGVPVRVWGRSGSDTRPSFASRDRFIASTVRTYPSAG